MKLQFNDNKCFGKVEMIELNLAGPNNGVGFPVGLKRRFVLQNIGEIPQYQFSFSSWFDDCRLKFRKILHKMRNH